MENENNEENTLQNKNNIEIPLIVSTNNKHIRYKVNSRKRGGLGGLMIVNNIGSRNLTELNQQQSTSQFQNSPDRVGLYQKKISIDRIQGQPTTLDTNQNQNELIRSSINLLENNFRGIGRNNQHFNNKDQIYSSAKNIKSNNSFVNQSEIYTLNQSQLAAANLTNQQTVDEKLKQLQDPPSFRLNAQNKSFENLNKKLQLKSDYLFEEKLASIKQSRFINKIEGKNRQSFDYLNGIKGIKDRLNGHKIARNRTDKALLQNKNNSDSNENLIHSLSYMNNNQNTYNSKFQQILKQDDFEQDPDEYQNETGLISSIYDNNDYSQYYYDQQSQSQMQDSLQNYKNVLNGSFEYHKLFRKDDDYKKGLDQQQC
eukprot:403331052